MSDASVTPGATIGEYRLLEPLAGAEELETPLWWARSERGERTLCAPLGPCGELAGPLYDRAQRLAHVDHPGLLPLVDSRSPDQEQPFLCWLAEPTPTLRTQLDDYLPELRRTVRIAAGIARVLAAIHESGEVHAGLSPANVLLAAGDRVILLAPGLSSLRAPPHLPPTGARYRAPEQLPARSEEPDRVPTIDRRADLWTLGVVLFELINGHPPFDGKTLEELALAQSAGAPPNPSTLLGGSLAGQLPDPLELIEARALQPDPAQRYQSAAELAGELEQVLAGMRPAARSAKAARPATAPRARRRPFVPERPLAPLALWLAPLLTLAVLIALIVWLST